MDTAIQISTILPDINLTYTPIFIDPDQVILNRSFNSFHYKEVNLALSF